jgi:hypothetical protein
MLWWDNWLLGANPSLRRRYHHWKQILPSISTKFVICVKAFNVKQYKTFSSICQHGRPPLWSSGQSSWLHNGNLLCFLCGTNRIYICYVEESRPLLLSSGQGSWLQNGDVLCFLRGTNWIYLCYVEESRPPLYSRGQSSWLQNGDILCFLWATYWIYVCFVEESRPPLLSSGQSSWLQIHMYGLDSRRYQIFWEVVGL